MDVVGGMLLEGILALEAEDEEETDVMVVAKVPSPCQYA
jgi:hypothetical protein